MVTVEEILSAFSKDSERSLGDEAIDQFEASIGFKLPKQLKALLQNFNGGNFAVGYMIRWNHSDFRGEVGNAYVEQFYGISPTIQHDIRSLRKYFEETGRPVEGVPESIFVFADDWSANPLTFDAETAEIGHVDHDTFGDLFTDPETYWVVAKDFADFLDRLEIAR